MTKRNGNYGVVARFGNGEYLGQDEDGGFVRVVGINNAYLGVEGELDESAEELSHGDDWEIVNAKETPKSIRLL